MKLTELEPQWIRHEQRIEEREHIVGDHATWRERGCPTEKITGPVDYHIHVDTIAEAQGVLFLCPKCFVENNGNVGTHSIICWQPMIPQAVKPVPGRWTFHGTGYDDLTLRANSSSVSVTEGCRAHFFITNGVIIGC